MELEFKRFQEKDFQEYASWFMDSELNRRLGPIDREWLGAVLSEKEAEGATWAVFRAGTFVAVAEAVFDSESELAVISGLAVKPDLCRQRIGTEVLTHLLVTHHERDIRRHVAYASVDNHVAQHCLKRVGFVLSAPHPNEHG